MSTNRIRFSKSTIRAAGFEILLALLLVGPPPGLWSQPQPHHFNGITVLADETVSLTLDGSVENMFNLTGTISNQFMQMYDLYPVEASLNLIDWTRLAVLVRTNMDPNPLLFQDTNAAGLDQRFYMTPTNHLITGFPMPTGPLGVGTCSRILTDPSRSNRYGITTNSSFMCTFWYPADASVPRVLPGPYTEPQVAGDTSLYNFWSFSPQWASVMPRAVGHSLPDVPPVPGTNRFPVILHSHGWTCDRRFNSQMAEELASHGYIVAAVDHEDSHATVFPDARGVCYVPPGSQVLGLALVTSRVRDLQCLPDELARIDASDALLAGRLDLMRIGVTGFSLGGGTAGEICRADSRVKCAALLDAFLMFSSGYYPALNQGGLQKPFLAMNRTILDHPPLWDASPDSGRLYALAQQDAVWLKIANAGHFAFSDCAWAVETSPSSRQAAAAINACVLWLFDTYLKGQSLPFPTNPELINVQRK